MKCAGPGRSAAGCAAIVAFRAFDPEVGRWCSPDPLGIEGGTDLNGWNGAPTVEMDPLGLSATGDPHLGHTPAITPGTNREMLGQAIANTNAHPVASERADFFQGQCAQITQTTGGSWNAARGPGADGSAIFSGDFGNAVVVSPQGELFTGKVTDPNHFSFQRGGMQPNYGALGPTR